jgi:hypothetical protein
MHKHSYLRSPWNISDCLIVIFSFIAYGLDTQFRTLRLVRVFRLLRALGRVQQLHSISVALANSTSRMADVGMLMGFVAMTMAVLGLQLFVEDFSQRCYFYLDPQAIINTTLVQYPDGGLDVITRAIAASGNALLPVLDPLDDSLCNRNDAGHTCSLGAECAIHYDVFHERYLTFDHIGYALFYVIKIISMDNWPGDNVKMQQGEGTFYFIFAFLVVIFGSYFCLNLILAILSSEYEEVVQAAVDAANSDKAQRGATTLIVHQAEFSEEEDEMIDLESQDGDGSGDRIMAIDAGMTTGSPTAEIRPVGARDKTIVRMLRDVAKALINNPWFSRFILFTTTVNVVALGCDHHLINPTFDRVLDEINFWCSIIFIIEAVIKIFALLAKYFYDPFNVFDVMLCLVSIPEMILSSGGSSFSALRAFRLARVVRVLNNSKTMRQLLITVVDAAKGSAFLFLFWGCSS